MAHSGTAGAALTELVSPDQTSSQGAEGFDIAPTIDVSPQLFLCNLGGLDCLFS